MKIRRICDYRVIVWPVKDYDGDEGKREAENIKKQIDRHVDGIQRSYVECTKTDICEFCKSEWEEDGDGQPLCCNKAVEEWERKKGALPDAPEKGKK